jgi:hypothetical protein
MLTNILSIDAAYLAAVRQGLIEFLEQETLINWRYYRSSIVPSLGAKGGVKTAKFSRVTAPGANDLVIDVKISRIATFQMRLLLAVSSSEDECEDLLLLWQQRLDIALHYLSLKGLTGTWKGQRVVNGLMGIQPSVKGFQVGIVETPSDQNDDSSTWEGALFVEFEYCYDLPLKSPFRI